MFDEYKAHLKAMTPSLAFLSGMLVIGFVIWNTIFFFFVYPYQRELGFLNETKYTHVIESSNDCGAYTRLKKLDSIITFTNGDGKRFNVNTYVPIETSLLGDLDLGKGDICISQKMAEKLGLSIGSRVKADYPVYDKPVEYDVRAIFPYASDLYNNLDNQDFSFVIVSDDGVLLNKTKGTVIYFLDDKSFNDYSSNEYSYFNRYDISLEKKAISIRTSILCIVMIILLIALLVSIAVLIHKEINIEVLKYYYDGYETSTVKSIDRRDHLVFLGTPIIIQIVWMSLGRLFASYPFVFFAITVTILLIMLIITTFVGGMKYGKAD